MPYKKMIDSYFSKYALHVLQKLKKAGFESYFVGGCVRDMLLSRQCSDYDIATGALPDEIKELFKKTVSTGAAFGTVTVFSYGKTVEVTSFRTEQGSVGRRYPKAVEFHAGILEDLKRRDFTVNSMACDETCQVLDPFGGQDDLKNKIIRCTGKADERFREDALRMIRGVRFCAVLGFDLESETLIAIRRHHSLTRHISRERIREEFHKIIESPNPAHVIKLFELGLLTPKRRTTQETFHRLAEKIEKAQRALKNRFPARLFLVLFCLSLEGVLDEEKFLEEFKYANAARKNILAMFRIQDEKNFDRTAVKRMLSHDPADVVKTAMDVAFALKKSDKDGRMVDDILKSKECFHRRHLRINGDDLKEIGLQKAQIRNALDEALSLCIKDPKMNEKDLLLQYFIRQQKTPG